MKTSVLLATCLLATLASASDDPVATTVENELVKPLTQKERIRSRMSRAVLPATARRVRVPNATPQKDEAGKAFVAFSVDAKHGWDFDEDEQPVKNNDGWQKDAITGCVYTDGNEVFIKKGKAVYPVGFLLGKKTKQAPATTCIAATAQLAAK